MNIIKTANVLDEPADALIYSTNALLNLTGGVGAQLLERYGSELQKALHVRRDSSGKRFLERGDIVELTLPSMPWKVVFHTLPCDALYQTSPEVVRDILRRCFQRCLQTDGVRRVALSALATGYGNLALKDFIDLFCSVADEPPFIDSMELVLCLQLNMP